MLAILEKTIKNYIFSDFPCHSRVHPLKSFATPQLKAYIKRDDELGLSGSKMRKFSSLIAHMLQQKVDQAIVIGGANSNHILGISQLLIENGIEPKLFLCQARQETLKGNAVLTKLLVPESQIQWIERQQWPKAYDIAKAYVVEKSASKKIFIVPEGGCQPEALPGALTLVNDILQNEKQLGCQFDHLFIDSGTGMMAIALLLGLAFIRHQGCVHVVLMAGTEQEFLGKLKVYHEHFSSLMKQHCPWPIHYYLCKPHQARAFGSTTAKTFKAIEQIAQQEGVLCDPIYNAKLFLEAKRKIFEENLQGNALVIQSGGTLSLLGFLQ